LPIHFIGVGEASTISNRSRRRYFAALAGIECTLDPRTKTLIEAPIASTLLSL